MTLTPDELAARLEAAVEAARAERFALAQELETERSRCHQAAAELGDAVRRANEVIRQCAKGEARKQLARALAGIADQLRVKV